MYSPSLQRLLIQARIQELHRSYHSPSTKPVITHDRAATPHWNATELASYLARAIERFVGHSPAEAPAN